MIAILKYRNLVIALAIFFISISLFSQAENSELPECLDVIFLIDVSGSMQFSLDGTNTNAPIDERRIQYVIDGLEPVSRIFTELLDSFTSVRYAIGKFPGTLYPEKVSFLEENESNNIELRRLESNSVEELNTIINNLDVRWQGTPIASALNNTTGDTGGALQMFINPNENCEEKTAKIIWLFTDGKAHETGNSIYITDENGIEYGSGSGIDKVTFKDLIDTDSNTSINKVKIVSLGFAEPSETVTETDFAMLNDISVAYGCLNVDNPNSITKTAICDGFNNIWDLNFSLTDPNFEIQPGTQNLHSEYVTKYDQKLIFLLTWSNNNNDSTLFFNLLTSTGNEINPEYASTHPEMRYFEGEKFKMYSVKKEFLDQNSGEWKIVIDAHQLTESLYYSYSILGSSDLKIYNKTENDKIPSYTGDKIDIKIALKEDGKPIQDARILAEIIGPTEGAGNWYARNTITPVQYDSVINLKFSGYVEDFYKKYYYLKTTRSIAIPSTITSDIIFNYNSEDGLYYGIGPRITIPGIYEVNIRAERSIHSMDYKFHRDFNMTYHIDMKPELDWEISNINFIKIKKEIDCNKIMAKEGLKKNDSKELAEEVSYNFIKKKCTCDIYLATITPLDKYKNYFKPGRAKNFSFNVNNAFLKGKVIDSLEGNYYQLITVPKATIQPSFQVRYNDFVFKRQNITDNPKADNWRFSPNAITLNGGITIPIQNLSNNYSSGIFFSIGYLRRLNRTVELTLSTIYSYFNGKNIDNLEYYGLSSDIRWYTIVNPKLRSYVCGGAGFFFTDKNSDGLGIKSGLGINLPLTSFLDFEIEGTIRKVFNVNPAIVCVQLGGGFLLRF